VVSLDCLYFLPHHIFKVDFNVRNFAKKLLTFQPEKGTVVSRSEAYNVRFWKLIKESPNYLPYAINSCPSASVNYWEHFPLLLQERHTERVFEVAQLFSVHFG
jgi:hypothetical protein